MLSALGVKYFPGVGEETRPYEIIFEEPKSALVNKVKELRELIFTKGLPEVNPEARILTGEVGWEYVRLYRKDEIREIVSKITGIPKDELVAIEGSFGWGPDFYVHYRDKVVAIVEVKTTTTSGRYPKDCLEKAEGDLRDEYFTEEKWRQYGFSRAKYGIPIAVFLKNLDDIMERRFSSIEHTIGEAVENPNADG